MKKLLFTISVTLASLLVSSQTCVVPGQTPATAFPVCGTSVFSQSTVPTCGGRIMPSPACASDNVADKNPFWYKFTCFKSGTLGFLITPNDLASDYDWELYDVSGKNVNDVYTDGTMVVASNWSGETGLTGASAAGTQRFVCAGTGKALFSSMPNLQVGHNYILLVSHFSNTQFGYSLSFKGGTAVITDPDPPLLRKAEANCGGDVVSVKLSKKIKCSSIALDGSDFFITPATRVPVSSVSIDCSSKFDADSINIKLNGFLPPGNYKLNIKNGSDGNTLLDYCDQPLSTSAVADFTILPIASTPMDSLVPVKCAPRTLTLVFDKPMLCSSVASNGSDFRITGPYTVGIASATANCSGTSVSSKEIVLTLSRPIERGGSFSIVLQNGSDGNTIYNECAAQTPAGASIAFTLRDTVNADFAYNIQYGCIEDIVNFTHDGRNGVDVWKWKLDDNMTSTAQNPQARYRVFDQKSVELIVSNGFCSDTSSQSFLLDNALKADFAVAADHCHSEMVPFKSLSQGKITSYQWDFGDGATGAGDSTGHIYSAPAKTTPYVVRHTVIDSYGCSKTVEKTVTVYVNCQIDIPNAFTPNADMKNDLLYPLNAIKAEQLEFKVYNRWGQLVFQTTDWKKGWDGKFNGQLQPSGSYVWMLKFVHRDTKQLIQKKGTSILIR